MKKYFITGLVILLPLALTIAIVVFVVNLLTQPFVDLVRAALNHFNLLTGGFLFLSGSQVQQIISEIIILILLFFFTVGLGYLASWFFIRYLFRFWDFIIHRIPFVSSIYGTCQDVIKTMFGSKTNSFKQVVMVPFPQENTYSIGLVTRENLPGFKNSPQSDLVAVFVPTTPNPTSGFLMLFKQSDLIYLDMRVEDAFKYVISCGVIAAPFKGVSKEEAQNLSQQKVDEMKESDA